VVFVVHQRGHAGVVRLASIICVPRCRRSLSGFGGNSPSLVVLSEYKEIVFGFCTFMLGISGYLQWRNRYAPCPVDPDQRDTCLKTRRMSVWIYGVSVIIFLTGAFFAFILPELAA
jgi:hypothetical protein